FFIQGEKKLDELKEKGIDFEAYQDERLETLQFELKKSRREKLLLIEQVETANEELQSSNEELIAANEELQSTNEELQSVNEELYTVNTELQSKINELTISSNDISNLLESTEIGTIFLDNNLGIRKFTPALREQFNLEEADIGRSITNFTNSFQDQTIYEQIKEVLATQKLTEREIQDTVGNQYLMRILPYRKSSGETDGVTITFININELKKSQADHKESAQSYQAIFENSNDIIMSIGLDGIVKSINLASFGEIEKAKVLGQEAQNLLSEEFRQIFKLAFQQIAEEKKLYQNIEVATPLSAKKRLWYSMTLTPIIVGKEIKHIIAISRDISKHKERELDLKKISLDLQEEVMQRNRALERANEELQEINSYLDSFVHGAAHDLRSPVMQMKGMINLFPKIKSIKEKDAIVQQFADGVYHLENTINGLIEMIEFQKNTDLIATEIDLIQAFEEVKNQLSHEIKAVNAKIETTFIQQPKIRYVKAYITSIFYNLLSNAIKYRSFDRPLEIQLTITKKEVYTLISISDNGIGIDLERYGHFLFKPFKRLTLERKGTGIGLSIINNVVRKNGGRIEVKSKMSKGATFSVYLVPYQKTAVILDPT
ncbi:MAG: PAS domain-containing protein, partial [Bacteroidota bacterium]